MEKEEFIKLTIFHDIVAYSLFQSTKDLWFGVTGLHKTAKDIIETIEYEEEHNDGEIWCHIKMVNYTEAEIAKAEKIGQSFRGY